MTIPLIAQLFFLALLLGFSAFFSGSETALFSLNRLALEKMRKDYSARAALVGNLLSHPRRLLVSIVMGNMLVNIFASALAERVSDHLFAGVWGAFSWVFSTVVMAFLILVVGEVIPKTLAIHRSEKVSLRFSSAVSFAVRLLALPVTAVRFVSDRIVGAIEHRRPPPEPPLTKEELTTAIRVESSLNGDEREMIIDIFSLGHKTVRQLMTPRTEIVSFEVETPLEEIGSVIRKREYSRIPIYSGKKENVVGILYPKDLIAARDKGVKNIAIGNYLRPPFFVPETMKAAYLLKEFLGRKVHIALVVDEYGGLSGLITLDDLVEEIVGEIRERGETAPLFEVVDADSVRVKGRVELDYLNESFGLDLISEDNVTLGGLICERLGRIPQPGETWEIGAAVFEVVSLKGPRVEEVVIRKRGVGALAPARNEKSR